MSNSRQFQSTSVIESAPVLYNKSSSNKPVASSSTSSNVISAPPVVSGPAFKTMVSYFTSLVQIRLYF
jgi:hypothetical protein